MKEREGKSYTWKIIIGWCAQRDKSDERFFCLAAVCLLTRTLIDKETRLLVPTGAILRSVVIAHTIVYFIHLSFSATFF